MSITLYEATVAGFIRQVHALKGVLEIGRQHAEANDIELNDLVSTKLCEDMWALPKQIISVRHHSVNAINGVKAGAFAPPTDPGEQNYAELETMISQTLSDLEAFTEDEVNAIGENDLIFSLGDMKLPFRGQDFLFSFSIPNFYFHATTSYDLLRMQGVPLGKKHFLTKLLLKQ